MNEQLKSYNSEIQPMIRNLLQLKELLKDHKESDSEILVHAQYVKEAQEALKEAIEQSERGAELLEQIKAQENDIKVAIKGASRGTEFKPADLKAYLFARAQQSVDKVLDKAELYEQLTYEIGE